MSACGSRLELERRRRARTGSPSIAARRRAASARSMRKLHLRDVFLPRGRQPAGGRPELQHALVEPFALPSVNRSTLVAVVADEEHARARRPRRSRARAGVWRLPRDLEQRARSRERLAAAAMMLALVDEAGVGAERDVVEEEPVAPRGRRRPGARSSPANAASAASGSSAVEPEVAGEVVAGAERDADEGGAGARARPAATGASEPSPPATPRISAPEARATSPGSSPVREHDASRSRAPRGRRTSSSRADSRRRSAG